MLAQGRARPDRKPDAHAHPDAHADPDAHAGAAGAADRPQLHRPRGPDPPGGRRQGAEPQGGAAAVGIDSADIVIVQPNGDGSTRLVPVFQSRYPEAVGPVRSLRPADVPLLSPIFPLVANTGAADWVLAYIDANSERLERMTYLEVKKTGAMSVDKARLYKAGGKTQYDRAIQAHPRSSPRSPPAPAHRVITWTSRPTPPHRRRRTVPRDEHHHPVRQAGQGRHGLHVRCRGWPVPAQPAVG
ncbi:DUF3048 domain-containing protein [Tessaracoccus sp. HDW20]|uniref:DUF3048 domain-containing protein n=1 Tax=Tessaracoccus coleopterorum TaxID=2714950 RepID=UPI0018D49C5F|nr:DUF3048 domain-containing protein [Tessaracoccus coleopterorum]NHB84267.1 DUF3048 domain-containing protein [Tessaracoccus coleopterorum]